MIARRAFLTTAAAGLLAALPTLSGCGGGGGDDGATRATITTGANGSFNGLRIGPPSGSTYISSATIFQAAWPGASEPPPDRFEVALHRYREARGGESRSDELQRIEVSQVAGTPAWNVRRANEFTLDTDGVYYLQLTAPGQPERMAAYIVASGRAQSPDPAATRQVNTGQNGRLQDVQISPTPGAVFLPRATTFRVTWPENTPPPPQFDATLMRYRERRGDAGRDVSAQIVTISQVDARTWDIKRRDDFDLDGGGVYYLELTAPGENPVRAAYIVSMER